MRTINARLVYCSVVAILAAALPAASAMKADWKLIEDGRVIVYFDTARPEFASGVLAAAQDSLARLNALFGPPAAGLWHKETRPGIYLYNSREHYLSATGQPAWSDGVSIQRLRVIYTFVSAKGLKDKIIAHELAHIMLKEIAGFDNSAMPAWFEEGIASLAENMPEAKIKARLRRLAFAGRLIPVSQLNTMEIRSRKDKGNVSLFYLQAYGLAQYLRYCAGDEKTFSSLLDLLRSGKDFEQALQQAYGLDGTAGLERSWLESLRKPVCAPNDPGYGNR